MDNRLSLRHFAFWAVMALSIAGLAPTAWAGEFALPDRSDYNGISLAKITAAPGSYRDHLVKFDAVYVALGRIFDPGAVGLTNSAYVNIYVCQPGLKLWEASDRAKIVMTLYVGRDNDDAVNALDKLKSYQHVVIWGNVVSDFQNMPWIVVDYLEFGKEQRRLTDSAISHIELGLRYQKEGAPRLAVREFERALAANPPVPDCRHIDEYLGDARFAVGEYAGAVEAYNLALMGVPDKEAVSLADLYLKLGRALLDGGRPAEAVPVLRQVVDRKPARPEGHADLAAALALVDNKQEALLECEQAIDLVEKAPEVAASVWRTKGRVHHILKEYAASESAYKEAILKQPYEALSHKELGIVYQDGGKNEEAEKEYTNAIKCGGKDAEVWLRRAQVRSALGNAKEAKGDCDEASKRREKYLDACVLKAKCCEALGEKEEAMAAYSKAAEMDPSNAGYPSLAARIAYDSGKYEEAIGLLKRATALAPNDFGSRYLLGKAYLGREEWAGARAELDVAVRLNPEDFYARINAALAYLKLQQPRGAILHLEAARRLEQGGDGNFDVQFNLGAAYAMLGDWNNCREAYVKAAKIDPKNAPALAAAAFWCADTGQMLDEASRWALAAVELASSVADYGDVLGWVQYNQGDYNKALSTLSKAAPLVGSADVNYHLGMTHLALAGPSKDESRLAEAEAKLGAAVDALSKIKAMTLAQRRVWSKASEGLKLASRLRGEMAREKERSLKEADRKKLDEERQKKVAQEQALRDAERKLDEERKKKAAEEALKKAQESKKTEETKKEGAGPTGTAR